MVKGTNTGVTTGLRANLGQAISNARSWSGVGRGEWLVDPDEPFILVGSTVTAAIIARKRPATP